MDEVEPVRETEPIGAFAKNTGRIWEDVRSRKFAGMKMVSGPAIESFLNAFHGLGPWVIGTDVEFLKKYAVPGVLDQLPPSRRPQ